MLRYLVSTDYLPTIQNTQLNQLVQNNIGKLYRAESIAIEEASSYLKQRWNVAAEFTNTPIWNPLVGYNANDRIIIDYATFSNISYLQGSLVTYNGFGYISNNNVTASATFSQSDWTNIGSQYSLYYAQYPQPLFNYNNYYVINDPVYWKGYTYSCNEQTMILDRESAIQYVFIQNLPPINVFPDDKRNNSNGRFWTNSGTYSVPIGTLPTDTSYWTQGDNRCLQMVLYITDITIFHLHKSIAPTNIPELRIKSYEEAINWLKNCYKGLISPNLTELQPTQGTMIRSGGNIRLNDTF